MQKVANNTIAPSKSSGLGVGWLYRKIDEDQFFVPTTVIQPPEYKNAKVEVVALHDVEKPGFFSSAIFGTKKDAKALSIKYTRKQ